MTSALRVAKAAEQLLKPVLPRKLPIVKIHIQVNNNNGISCIYKHIKNSCKLKTLQDVGLGYIKNGFSFKFDIKSFPVISLSAANLARNINIGKKMHFNFNNTVTLASLTSTALNIKRKAICLIPLLLSVGGLSIKFSDIVKNACVC